MDTNLEIEFKILLTATQYEQIVLDYQKEIKNQYIQTNYYLMHPTLDEYQYMLRIRKKEGTYELTLKEPRPDGNLETNIPLSKEEANTLLNGGDIKNQITEKLSTLHISLSDLNTDHSLTTIRSDIIFPIGVLSIDKNTYENTIDYELEFEVIDKEKGKLIFFDIIKKYNLSYQQNCPSKIKRLKQLL